MAASTDSAQPPSNGQVLLSLVDPTAESCTFDFGTLEFQHGHKLSPKSTQVLYCLLQRAGETVSKDELLDSVWSGQARVPDVLVQSIADIRRGLGDALRSGLRTIPKHGYRLELQVQWLAAESDAAPLQRPHRPAAPAPTTPRPGRRWPLLVGLLAIVLFGALLLSQLMDRRAGPIQQATPTLQVRAGARLSFEPGPDRQPTLSPDGQQIAYVRPVHPGAVWKVHLRHRGDAGPAQRLSRADAAIELQPAWSNAGDRLAWLRIDEDGCRFVIHRLADGEQHLIGDCFRDIAPGFAWSADDQSLLITDRMESRQRALHLVLLDLEQGERRLLDYPRAEQQADYHPRLSPDRQYWAFLRSAPQATELWLMDSDGRHSRKVASFAAGVAGYDWLADGTGWLVVGSGEQARPWWRLDRSGQRQPLSGPDLVQPRRAAAADVWIAEQAAEPSRLWRGKGAAAQPLAPSEAGHDSYPLAHPAGGLVFVSTRRGQAELWWQPELGSAPTPIGSPADAFGRPVWWDAASLLVPVRRATQWQLERHWLLAKPGETLDLAPYQISELARVGGNWFAVGSLIDSPGKSELLRLRADGDKLRAEATGIAAIALRSDGEALWIRQYLQRGLRSVDPATLALGEPIGDSHHFIDWRVEDDGLLYWRRRDLLRHELVWIDPLGQQAERVELAADEAYDPYSGLARLANGELLIVRRNADAGDLHALKVTQSP